MAFLLVLSKEGVAGERVYGLAVVWAHPCQARVPTIDEAARKLALLASSGSNWPYTFVCFNGDTHHVPLSKEGHLSAMTDGTPSNIPCRQIFQLRGPSIFAFRGPSSIPQRTEWVPSSGNNIST